MMYNWFILSCAVAVLIYVGYISHKHTAKIEGNSSFLVGGNKVGVFVGALSVLATGYSGWGFIGSPGMAYRYGGIEVLGNLFFAPAMVLGAFLAATVLKKKSAEYASYTVPEFVAAIHPGSTNVKKAIQFIAAAVTIILLLVYLMGQIRAVSLVASTWLRVPPLVATIVLMLVLVIFTAQGGLLAVARTDMIMCLGMLISSLVVGWIIFSDVSIKEMVDNLSAQNTSLVNPPTSEPYGGGQYSVYLIFAYAFLFTTTLPYMNARFLSFEKNLKPHLLVLIMAPAALILSIVPLAGLYMRMKSPSLPNPDVAMPLFLEYFVPPAIAGLINLFILFAMLSTISSVLHAIASSAAYDLRKAFGAKMVHNKIINTLAVVAAAFGGVVLTFYAPPMMLNQIAIIGTGGLISLLAGPIFVHFFLPFGAGAALLSMISGLASNILFTAFLNFGWVEAPICASLVGALVYIVTGYLLTPKTAISQTQSSTD